MHLYIYIDAVYIQIYIYIDAVKTQRVKHRETPTAADKKNVIKNGKYFGLNKIHIGLLQCLNVRQCAKYVSIYAFMKL